MAKHTNKYLYGWRLYVNYGHSWEYEVFELTWADMRNRIKEYRENCPQYALKTSYGRESNPEYMG